MKFEIRYNRILMTPESDTERKLVHELRVRGCVTGMRLHRCLDPDSTLELFVPPGPGSVPEQGTSVRMYGDSRECVIADLVESRHQLAAVGLVSAKTRRRWVDPR